MNGCDFPRTLACALALGLAIGFRTLAQTPGLTVAPASIDGGGGLASGEDIPWPGRRANPMRAACPGASTPSTEGCGRAC